MASSNPSPAEAISLARQIVDILAPVDSETRWRATQAAMLLLGENLSAKPLRDSPIDESDLSEFFTKEEGLEPADNTYLCAAYHYACHGAVPFSIDDLRRIASEAGVILPDRIDMTLKQAGGKGRRLFQKVGQRQFKPTASGAVFFKERWDVRPGRIVKEASAAS